ncbi:ANTAR domain-containing protein [Glaciihabitans tibetensis]|uniref:ANTAR domain-containing protein n=1 Tax=Glaciihabitans tibetensis TaxID=1266600 RepID=A0A2T0VK30_9MICO|nr:GAF and ANTAR domain-containing protein [Glaciihabitans tibetensis]PRY70554.1 ANTAR domain-containing protein [Glaciihabitans tibetensis]
MSDGEAISAKDRGHAEFERARRDLTVAHEHRSSLCEPFLRVIPVTGASVSVLSAPVGQSTVCASNETAARLDELQFDLGEGPCWTALASKEPVLAPVLADQRSKWPMFADAVLGDTRGREVAGMFVFPLVVGTLEIGAVDLYSTEHLMLSQGQIADASALAGVAAWQVLRRILGEEAAGATAEAATGRASRREVHQATGMVLAQLGVSADDAALLLRAHAFATGRSVRDVATDVVERRLDFSAQDG